MNCTLSAPTYGTFDVWCTNLSLSLRFQNTQSDTRNHHVMYPYSQENSQFTVTAEFGTYDPYNAFNMWLMGFALKASDPDQAIVAMRVDVPTRLFSAKGVPTTGIGWQRRFDDVKWTSMITFMPVEDQVAYNSPLLSVFQLGAKANEDVMDQSKYFYPGGLQLSETDRDAQTLKDITFAQDNFHPPNVHAGQNRLL